MYFTLKASHFPHEVMDREFDIDPEEFQDRKRRRISTMNAMAPPPPKVAPTSAPGIHEIATFLPGRLEFEHELDNDAEDLVKDLEFGVCLEYGGDQIIEDEEDQDVRARQKWLEERQNPPEFLPPGRGKGKALPVGKGPTMGFVNGKTNGHNGHGSIVKQENNSKSDDTVMVNGTSSQEDDAIEEPTQPPPIETPESLKFKLTLMEMYTQRVEKRQEGKSIIFNRGLLEYKKVRLFCLAYSNKAYRLPRCKPLKRSVHAKRETFFTACVLFHGYRLPQTTRHFLLIFSVSLVNMYHHHS